MLGFGGKEIALIKTPAIKHKTPQCCLCFLREKELSLSPSVAGLLDVGTN